MFTSVTERKKADLLVVPFWKGEKAANSAVKELGSLNAYTKEPIDAQDFTGKSGQLLVVYTANEPEKRLALLGLGEEKDVTVETIRSAYGNLVSTCQKLKLKEVNLLMPFSSSLSDREMARGVAEGILLMNYTFEKLKNETVKDSPTTLIEQINLINASQEAKNAADKAHKICEGVYLTRNLVNDNADDVNPERLAEVAKTLGKQFKAIKTTVFDKKRIEKEKMGLLLAVNRGGPKDPVFIIAEYKGDPKAKECTVVVGKGVTFDTGGLNLKRTGGIETMKYDMAGAATALGILHATASLGLKLNLTIVIPSTENAISATSYKPGDVYRAYDGQTVEIGNTDAEGRLILADALAYTVKNLSPTRILDFATLTGAIEITFGNEAIGLMSNNDSLQKQLLSAGEDTFERAWALPMFKEYRDKLKSEVADISNTGRRGGGSITAAKFLESFVGDVPWAHFDIAGTANFDKATRYFPKHATGMGVRLTLSFLEELARE